MRPGLTPGEAGLTWCPFAKAVHQDTDRHVSNNCIATYCMAWRWVDPALTNEPKHVRRPMADQRKGFCGLAGPIDTVVDWNNGRTRGMINEPIPATAPGQNGR